MKQIFLFFLDPMHGLNIIYNVLDAPDKTMALLGFYILTLRAHLNSTEYK